MAIGGGVPTVAASGYSFTYIGGCSAESTGSDTDLACTSTLNVASGDTLIVFSAFYGSSAFTNTVGVTGDTNLFTMESNAGNGDANGKMGIITSASGNAVGATVTFRQTLGTAATYRSIFVLQFRKTGGTVSKDTAATATGTGTAVATSAFSTTAGALVVGAEWDGNVRAISTTGSPLIGTTELESDSYIINAANTRSGVWWLIYEAAQTDITASCTLTSSGAWTAYAIAAKAE